MHADPSVTNQFESVRRGDKQAAQKTLDRRERALAILARKRLPGASLCVWDQDDVVPRRSIP